MQELPKEEWKKYFDELSVEYIDWETKVEVLNGSIGAQILSEGLPLNGITYEGKDGQDKIEIIVGHDADKHQTHSIADPVRVYSRQERDLRGEILEIEDVSGTKTIVHIIRPIPVLMQYVETELIEIGV
jgi:Family of unknown function (DUF5335)